MKLVIDMSALSVDKRKMVVDYLQDNDVPITWAPQVNPQMDIYAEVAKEANSLPTAPLKNWGTPDRFVGKHPALAAPYLGFDPAAEGRDWSATQEWADAEARRQQGLEPKPTTPARYSMTQIDELLKSEWVEKSGGLVWAYCPRNGVDRCTLAISRITGSDHVWLEKEYQGTEARDQAHKFLQGLEPKRDPFRNEVAQLCYGTRTKHRWAPTRPLLSYKSPSGKEAPILECVHCCVRIYGPYEELPLHLRNEDDPSVNMHHQD